MKPASARLTPGSLAGVFFAPRRPALASVTQRIGCSWPGRRSMTTCGKAGRNSGRAFLLSRR
eukprot:5118921-Alexandrium_andersonii.AAC.1